MYEWRISLPVIFVARTSRGSSRIEKVISQVFFLSSLIHLQSAVKWWTWEGEEVLKVGNGEAGCKWKCERTFSQSINQISTVSWWSCSIFTNNSLHDLSNNLARLVSCYMSGSTLSCTQLTELVAKKRRSERMNIQMSPRPHHYSSINMSGRGEKRMKQQQRDENIGEASTKK